MTGMDGELMTCAACGFVFIGISTEEEMEAERQAFADTPDAPLEVVCDDCFKAMREQFPSLDARLKLEGL